MRSWLRIAGAAVRAQIAFTRNDIEDLRPLASMPLVSLVGLAILTHSGRGELAPYALVAATLRKGGASCCSRSCAITPAWPPYTRRRRAATASSW